MSERDMTPAVGTGAEPAWGRREGAEVGLHKRDFQDARWSFLYEDDTRYATTEPPAPGLVEDAASAQRTGPSPPVVQGPMMKPPVWTWEIPLYFWFGGIAAGS